MSNLFRLSELYRANHYHVREVSDCLMVGFKAGSVSFIVKEIRNTYPLRKEDAEKLYKELLAIGSPVSCRYFRVIAYGGYRKDALAFELHGLTVSDGQYVERLASGRHIELFPHNEAHASDRILVIAPNVTILDEIRQAVAGRGEEEKGRAENTAPEDKPAASPPVLYRTFQALARSRGKTPLPQAEHIRPVNRKNTVPSPRGQRAPS